MTRETREALRYLGYKSAEADAETLNLIEQCREELGRVCEPKHTCRRFEIVKTPDGGLNIAALRLNSRALARNLRDCREAFIIALTLGRGSDMLMNRYLRLSISKAAVLQAVAAAYIESYFAECRERIGRELKTEGLYLRPPFSPGYGDLPLSIQGEVLRVLEAQKTVGIYLSDGDIMLPEKSVTAFMGISRFDSRCPIEGCEVCDKLDCAYRR